MKLTIKLISILSVLFLTSCATFKSPMNGKYEQAVIKNDNAEKVNVLFVFSHYQQTIGIDAIPKLTRPRWNFNDVFSDALTEISNIGEYNSFTMEAKDVNNVEKRESLIRAKEESDYFIEINFTKEKSFIKFFFSTITSSISATTIPMRYKYKYKTEVNVYNHKQQLINSYSRDADLNKWVQTFMVFLYPFHHEKRKKEDLYVECLHDIFKQIETEKILDYNNLENVTRTIYSSSEIFDIFKKHIPADVIRWNKKPLNSWVEDKDIGIIVHFPDDGINNKMASEAFKMDVEELDTKTENDGILYWVDNDEKHPILLISARNEAVLKSQIENNNHLKVLLNGMFYMQRK